MSTYQGATRQSTTTVLSAMPANVEIKAHVEDFEVTSNLASTFADDPKPSILIQCDTFFHVPNGRLKLREQKDGKTEEDSPLTYSELIAYDRIDTEGPKQSTFSNTIVKDPKVLNLIRLAIKRQGLKRYIII